MNRCSFFGTVHSIDYSHDELSQEQVEIKLVVENKRVGKKKPVIDEEVLVFEAWGSAAKMLSEYLQKDDRLLIVDSTARVYDDGVVFRINEFKLIEV